MARDLVTFATRKCLTSFVGRPDRLRRQAHPAPPSTPCIPPSRPSRSSTTPNGASRKMRRTRRATPASAATASRSPTPPTGGGGRAATRLCGTPGSSPASASVSAGRRSARHTRLGRKEYPPRPKAELVGRTKGARRVARARAAIIGCSSLGGGSRRQNIATVIQTAYNMGGRMSRKREPIVVFHVSPILYARP